VATRQGSWLGWIEHLTNGHPILTGILSKLFNLIIQADVEHVLAQYGLSYTVPLVKINGCTKNLSVDDGIILSVLLYLKYSNNVFYVVLANISFHQTINLVLRKLCECSHAIYTVRSVVDHISYGSALDVSTAFHK